MSQSRGTKLPPYAVNGNPMMAADPDASLRLTPTNTSTSFDTSYCPLLAFPVPAGLGLGVPVQLNELPLRTKNFTSFFFNFHIKFQINGIFLQVPNSNADLAVLTRLRNILETVVHYEHVYFNCTLPWLFFDFKNIKNILKTNGNGLYFGFVSKKQRAL